MQGRSIERSRAQGVPLAKGKGSTKNHAFNDYMSQQQGFRLPYIIATSPLRDMPVVVPSYNLERIKGDGLLIRK